MGKAERVRWWEGGERGGGKMKRNVCVGGGIKILISEYTQTTKHSLCVCD